MITLATRTSITATSITTHAIRRFFGWDTTGVVAAGDGAWGEDMGAVAGGVGGVGVP
jgi:hypothetical protein